MFPLIITTLSVLCCGAIADVPQSGKAQPIDHLIVLTRHGERHPLMPVPELGDFALGTLTANGYKTEKDFGSRILTRYPNCFAGKPIAHLKAPNESRCVVTAIAIFDGLSIENYFLELLEMITVDPKDKKGLMTLAEQADKIVLPPCIEAALTKAGPPIDPSLPESVNRMKRLLFKFQLIDAIDTLIQSGYRGKAFGIDLATCVTPGLKLMTEEGFAALVDLCRPGQCDNIISSVTKDLRSLADESLSPGSLSSSISVYGLTDVHILDLLQTLLPQFNHTRPQFGGFILLEVRGDNVTILSGEDVFQDPREWLTINIHDVIQLLRARIEISK